MTPTPEVEVRKRGQYGTFYVVVTRGSRSGLIQHPMEVYGVFNTEAQANDFLYAEYTEAEVKSNMEVHSMQGFLEDGFEDRVILTEWVGAYGYNPHYESDRVKFNREMHRKIWDRLSAEERAYLKMEKPDL